MVAPEGGDRPFRRPGPVGRPLRRQRQARRLLLDHLAQAARRPVEMGLRRRRGSRLVQGARPGRPRDPGSHGQGRREIAGGRLRGGSSRGSDPGKGRRGRCARRLSRRPLDRRLAAGSGGNRAPGRRRPGRTRRRPARAHGADPPRRRRLGGRRPGLDPWRGRLGRSPRNHPARALYACLAKARRRVAPDLRDLEHGPMTEFSPREIVSELDRYIVGHTEAKKAVAVALRNRWRRRRVPADLRDEVTPKNILMIGPTGVGKTEIARRLARLAQAPFLKVEATKFTEVGYVGRDVDQIVRDLVESALAMVRDKRRAGVRAKAEAAAEERILDALTGPGATAARDSFRKKLRAGELDDKEVELQLADSGGGGMFEIPGQPGASVLNLSEMMKSFGGGRTKTHKTTVVGAWAPLIAEESDKLLDQEALTQEALELAENHGIVFLDEIDEVASRAERAGADVSREGVQRDLLPLIEGTTVSTKYGPVKTDHILFIASGAFHVAKPSDLLPELQGRLPIRVELKPLTKEDFRRILTETEASLIRQYKALMETEGLTLDFTDDAIDALDEVAVHLNSTVENIGARRLQTIMERLVEELSFDADEKKGQTIRIEAAYVHERVGKLAGDTD